MDNRLSAFVRALYFDLQTIEGVKPLEIWSGFRDPRDPYEMAGLMKNLYKIVVPLVNEHCYGRPWAEHSRLARAVVAAVNAWFSEDPEARLFQRFPYPPTGDADQKQLYHAVKDKASLLVESLDAQGAAGAPAGEAPAASAPVPDSLFDFREMRIVDNELPFIIFTDKEFRVIRGLAIVYLWLIDLDAIFLETLAESGMDPAFISEYRALARKARKENPLTVHGKRMEAEELVGLLHEKLQREDYLDLFENVYRWFEQARSKLAI